MIKMQSVIHQYFKLLAFTAIVVLGSCQPPNNPSQSIMKKSAKDILGNPEYQAISYGGYRKNSRDIQPTVAELREDMEILHAMGIRVLRTYNVQLAHASNVLKAITEIQAERPDFEMYVMLGAWIDCENAWTDQPPVHHIESAQNAGEVARAVTLAQAYPDIVKVIAVGNEAMVKWATSYYVEPYIILKWVRHLQGLKQGGDLPADLWITSSDNFASWGGGDAIYHVPELDSLIAEVDFLSVHTYPMHDTHYNPAFWLKQDDSGATSDHDAIRAAMVRSVAYARSQYLSVKAYMLSQGVDKPVHIGETGWASASDGLYGPGGSRACDEYKQGLYYKMMREWTDSVGISCFYFEAFDEPWKDAGNPSGSENHFGLFDVSGSAKYAIWDHVIEGQFDNVGRNGEPVVMTHNGDLSAVKAQALSIQAPVPQAH